MKSVDAGSIRVLVDADACPVKQEVYRVARRYGLEVTLVANSWMQVPAVPWLQLVVVDKSGQLDDADDWIAERATDRDVVVTADIPLAARALGQGARAISPRGKLWTEDSIGSALAHRDLMTELREAGTITGGPPPFEKRDRSRFLQRLDQAVQAIRRRVERAD